jgi:hypothetical protein
MGEGEGGEEDGLSPQILLGVPHESDRRTAHCSCKLWPRAEVEEIFRKLVKK